MQIKYFGYVNTKTSECQQNKMQQHSSNNNNIVPNSDGKNIVLRNSIPNIFTVLEHLYVPKHL